MADLDNKKIIKKLEEASNSNEKTVFINQDISNLRLTKLNMTGHLFKKCSFYVTKFYGCVFIKCEFLDCNFSNSDLLNVKFLDCTFVNCDFTEATLQDVLVEGGFKTNNIFTDLNIVGNVTGISQEDSEIISEENNKMENILDKFKILKKENNEYVFKTSDQKIILSISNDIEISENTWRIMISTEIDGEYDPIISDTIEFPCTKQELYDCILNIIKFAVNKISRLNDLNLTNSINELLTVFKALNVSNLNNENDFNNNVTIELLEQKWNEIYSQITDSTSYNSNKEFTFGNGDIKIEASPVKIDDTLVIKINIIYISDIKNIIINTSNFYIDENTTPLEFINYILKLLKHEARTTNVKIKNSLLKLIEKWINKKIFKK